jgi:beta-lactamase regulating signal transducer with metallopeptidase domain
MISTLFGTPSSDVLAAGLTLLKMTCVLLAALGVTLAMRRASAGARHLVWLVALGALIVLPAVAAWGPLTLRMLPQASERITVSSQAILDDAAAVTVTPAPATDLAAASPGRASAPAPRIDTATLLVALWAFVALALLVRLAVGAWWVRRIVRGARELDAADWRQPLYDIADRLGLDDAPRLYRSERVKIPFASGFSRVVIVLPAACDGWSAERRVAVLMHELAHVARRDLIGHTVSRLVCALYWFHPLVWVAARRLRSECERACDDLALGLGARPSDYAEHLLDIVAQFRGHATPAVAIAMANPNEFEGRMLAILDPRIRRRGPSRAQTVWLAGSFAALALAVGAVSLAPRVAATTAGPEPAGSSELAVVLDEPRAPADAREGSADPSVAADIDDDPENEPDAIEPIDEYDARDETAEAEANGDEEKGVRRVAIMARTLRSDDSPEVRRVAAWGLHRYAGYPVAADALAEALAEDDKVEVREMAAWALSDARGQRSAVTALEHAMKRDRSPSVRRTAAWAAGSMSHRALTPALVTLLDAEKPELREVAAWSIGQCGGSRAPAELVEALDDPEPGVRLAVVWALREIGDAESADEIEVAFRREKDPDVQMGMIRALGSMGDRAVDTLSKLVSSSDPAVRQVAITALAGGNATGPWPWPRPEPRPFP